MVEVAAAAAGGGGGGAVMMGDERFVESGVPHERRRNEEGEESGGRNLRFLWQLPLLFNPHGRSPLSRAEQRRHPAVSTPSWGRRRGRGGRRTDGEAPSSPSPSSLPLSHSHTLTASQHCRWTARLLPACLPACRQTARLPFCAKGGENGGGSTGCGASLA